MYHGTEVDGLLFVSLLENVDESSNFVYTVIDTDEVEIKCNTNGSCNYWFNNRGEEVTNNLPEQ